MKKPLDKENFDMKLVALFISLVVLFGIGFCFLMYDNQVRTIKFNLQGYKTTESTEKASITQISETEKYLKVEGQVHDNIITYQVYVGLEDEEGNMKMYKTEGCDDNKFYTLIKKKNLEKKATINIIYMCNDQKIVIKTDQMIGEKNHE